jgi:polyferredoxin
MVDKARLDRRLIHTLERQWNLTLARNIIQVGLSFFLLFEGWRFYQFVQHFQTNGSTPFVERPASVDGFLPMSALVSLKVWIGTGVFDQIHPAALVILLTIVFTSWLFPKAFCGWLCPIGTISEGLWRLGQRVFGRNFNVPRLLDLLLRSLRYLLLLSFLSAAFINMPVSGAVFFQSSDYNKIADVKMLEFYLHLGEGTLIFFLVMGVASLFVRNFWCRYLCPYGALLGIFGALSPLMITRDSSLCTECRRCTQACPNRIDMAHAPHSISPECTSCLNCIVACPRRGALTIRPVVGNRIISPRLFAASLMLVFFGILLLAQVTGHWQSSLLNQDYSILIPKIDSIGHY